MPAGKEESKMKRLAVLVLILLSIVVTAPAGMLFAGTLKLDPDSADPPGLRPFLEKFMAAVEAADWEQVLQLFDPDNYAAQIELLEGDELQYIAEGIGLYGDGGEHGDNLHAIGTIIATGIEHDSALDLYTVTGTIRLDDGREFDLQLFVVAADNELGWMIQPAVG